ncbi:aldose 1-epimerase family protein [Terriglobus tenax]|uniref:aldose 1-epimerase family protein n=1 Tax=Terriglobus tenax TaxID=1111115 RepID=UPI0021E0E9F1|nr:aldose 1-epimerase family protein [Terriglobus tenax]
MGSETRTFLEERTGRLSQLGGVTAFEYADGKAKGVSALRVRTAVGLEFWVMPGRGMDIGEAYYYGKSLSWQSATGITHPAYHSDKGLDWLRGFYGGLLCFCGLSHAGAPSEDDGKQLGLHGFVSNTPAEQVSWSEDWVGDDCIFTITGKVREASVFGPNLLLTRKITASLKTSRIAVEDTVENQGYGESPLMALYHLNFGYPLLTGKSQIFASPASTVAATPHAQATFDEWNVFNEPVRGMGERVYFHTMKPGTDGWVNTLLVSDREKKDWAVSVKYDPTTLPDFIEWKLTGVHDFVLGFEPANCRSLGRKKERERGTLKIMQPGEKVVFRIQFDIHDGVDAVQKAIAATEV